MESDGRINVPNFCLVAPKRITKHLILAPLPPQISSTEEAVVPSPSAAPSKRPQPLEKLKYRNLPFGAVNTDTKTIVDEVDPQRQTKRKVDMMDIDEVAAAPSSAAVTAPLEAKKEKKKSRKSEVGQSAESKSERKEKKSSRKSKA